MLLSHLETPLEIGLLFRRVRAQVLAATNGAQRPHEYHSLVGEHYLTRTLAMGASVTVTAAVAADPTPADPPRPDPDAKIAKMKDGRTHLAHKAEHGVDMDTGAIVSVTVQDASDGDTATLPETLIMAAEQVELVQPDGAGVEEVVADKGYHSDETLVGLREVGVRSQVSEPERGRRRWQDKKTGETPPKKRAAQQAAGTTAAAGRGRNSPYTATLLSHLETPLELGLLFRRIRAQVLASTNGQQRPHEYHSLVGEHYLTRTLATGSTVMVSAATADPAPADPPRSDPEADVTELPTAVLRELAEAGER